MDPVSFRRVLRAGKLDLAIVFWALVCLVAPPWTARAATPVVGEAELIPVAVDVRPGLCPNHLRVGSHLTLPIAILGTVDFEVTQVDPETVRLTREGIEVKVKPIQWTYADVGIPVIGGLCACHKLRGDGLDDLEFRFAIRDLVETLNLKDAGNGKIKLVLTGRLIGGEPIEGIDCVEVIGESEVAGGSPKQIGMLPSPEGLDLAGISKFSYYNEVSDRVTFAIHDVTGRVVARLIDMDMSPGIYSIAWDRTVRDGLQAPPGIYFARVSNGEASDIRKITIPR